MSHAGPPPRLREPVVPAGDLRCPLCGSHAEKWRVELRYTYRCAAGCDTRVGCDKWGRPLGTLADYPTRQARIMAHKAFDRLWQDKPRGHRGRAYKWLRATLQLSKEQCHIGMFDRAQCESVVELCGRRFAEEGDS